jgi:hypothetical protein
MRWGEVGSVITTSCAGRVWVLPPSGTATSRSRGGFGGCLESACWSKWGRRARHRAGLPVRWRGPWVGGGATHCRVCSGSRADAPAASLRQVPPSADPVRQCSGAVRGWSLRRTFPCSSFRGASRMLRTSIVVRFARA